MALPTSATNPGVGVIRTQSVFSTVQERVADSPVSIRRP